MSSGTPLVSVSEQTRRLGELRRRVGRLPQDVVVNRDEDAAFRRFLVARKWDVDKAEEQLRNSLRWRAQEYRVLAFLSDPPLQRLALVRRLLPANPFLGFSKAGFPITLLCLGSSEPATVARELKADDLIADFVVRAEFFRAVVFEQASARASETIDKEVVLLDFGGMSLGLLKLTSLFKAMNAVGSTYFPERTVLFFVLNAPRAFSTLWSIAKGLVDPRTQKKVHILSDGKRQLAALREVMDDSVIPTSYGGSRPPPTTSGADAADTSAIYERLDAWLRAQSAKTAPPPPPPPPPPSPPPPPQPSPLRPKSELLAFSNLSPAPAVAPPPRVTTPRSSRAAAVEAPMPTALELLVLLLLWLLGTATFATLAWSHAAGRPEL